MGTSGSFYIGREGKATEAEAVNLFLRNKGLDQYVIVGDLGTPLVFGERLVALSDDQLQSVLTNVETALDNVHEDHRTRASMLGYALMTLKRRTQLEKAQRTYSSQVEAAQATVDRVDDSTLRQELSSLLSKINEQQQQIEDLTQESRDADRAAMLRLKYRQELWQMRKSLLEREPAAVLLGGVLLLAFATVLIVATFTGTNTPEIVASAFLLILGFFFGQTSSRIGGGGGDN